MIKCDGLCARCTRTVRRQWHRASSIEHVALHYSIDNNHRNELTSAARLWLVRSPVCVLCVHMKNETVSEIGLW